MNKIKNVILLTILALTLSSSASYAQQVGSIWNEEDDTIYHWSDKSLRFMANQQYLLKNQTTYSSLIADASEYDYDGDGSKEDIYSAIYNNGSDHNIANIRTWTLISATYYLLGGITYAYYPDGLIHTKTLADNTIFEYSDESLTHSDGSSGYGRIIKQTNPDGTYKIFSSYYNADQWGVLKEYTMLGALTVTYEYYASGRLKTEERLIGYDFGSAKHTKKYFTDEDLGAGYGFVYRMDNITDGYYLDINNPMYGPGQSRVKKDLFTDEIIQWLEWTELYPDSSIKRFFSYGSVREYIDGNIALYSYISGYETWARDVSSVLTTVYDGQYIVNFQDPLMADVVQSERRTTYLHDTQNGHWKMIGKTIYGTDGVTVLEAYTYYLSSGRMHTNTISSGTTYEYDDTAVHVIGNYGHLIKETRPDGTYKTFSDYFNADQARYVREYTSSNALLKIYEYNASGVLVGMTDTDDTVYTYYVPSGRMATKTLATPDLSGNIYYEYSDIDYNGQGYGQLIKSKRLIADSDGCLSYTYAYYADATGRLQHKYGYSDGNWTILVVHYAYYNTQANRMYTKRTSIADAAGNDYYVYLDENWQGQGFGRVQFSASPTIDAYGCNYCEYYYYDDAFGRLREKVCGNYAVGPLLTYSYYNNATNRLASKTLLESGSLVTYTYYDEDGFRLATKTGFESGVAVTYTYYNDMDNRMESKTSCTSPSAGTYYYHYINENWGGFGYGRVDKSYIPYADSDGCLSFAYSYSGSTNRILQKICYSDYNWTTQVVAYTYYDDTNNRMQSKAIGNPYESPNHNGGISVTYTYYNNTGNRIESETLGRPELYPTSDYYYHYMDEAFYVGTDGFSYGRIDKSKRIFTDSDGCLSYTYSYLGSTDRIITKISYSDANWTTAVVTYEYNPDTGALISKAYHDASGWHKISNFTAQLGDGQIHAQREEVYSNTALESTRDGSGRVVRTIYSDGHSVYNVYAGQSIQSAINSASAGDTIYIHAGTYNEHLMLPNGVNLVGEDGATISGGYQTNSHIIRALGNNRIENLIITGGGSYSGMPSSAIRIEGNNVSIRNNTITDNRNYAVFVWNGNNILIEGNLFTNNHLGIQLPNAGTVIQYNTFVNNEIAINVLDGRAAVIKYNIITGSTFQSIYEFSWSAYSAGQPMSGYAIIEGNVLYGNREQGGHYGTCLPPAILNQTLGNLITNPLFVNPATGDYSVPANSPAYGIGAFLPQAISARLDANFDSLIGPNLVELNIMTFYTSGRLYTKEVYSDIDASNLIVTYTYNDDEGNSLASTIWANRGNAVSVPPNPNIVSFVDFNAGLFASSNTNGVMSVPELAGREEPLLNKQ